MLTDLCNTHLEAGGINTSGKLTLNTAFMPEKYFGGILNSQLLNSHRATSSFERKNKHDIYVSAWLLVQTLSILNQGKQITATGLGFGIHRDMGLTDKLQHFWR